MAMPLPRACMTNATFYSALGTKRKFIFDPPPPPQGHMRFVGELYKVELLKERHVHAVRYVKNEEETKRRKECFVGCKRKTAIVLPTYAGFGWNSIQPSTFAEGRLFLFGAGSTDLNHLSHSSQWIHIVAQFSATMPLSCLLPTSFCFDGIVLRIQAIHDMFGNADEPDEERLECMVKLLQTCGKKLDQTGSPDTVKVSQPANQSRKINNGPIQAVATKPKKPAEERGGRVFVAIPPGSTGSRQAPRDDHWLKLCWRLYSSANALYTGDRR